MATNDVRLYAPLVLGFQLSSAVSRYLWSLIVITFQLSAAAASQDNQNSLMKQFSDLQIEYNATDKKYKTALDEFNTLNLLYL